MSLASDVRWAIKSLFDNPDFSGIIVFPLLIVESITLEYIILNVPYTEIDYSTYMQQISLIAKGELHYSHISGDTGPIVYPAGYVWIFSWLRWLTDGMAHLRAGQECFRFVYLITQLLTCVAYNFTSVVKPYVIYMLLMSKRLHSIYVLRLFNDCFTTLFAVASIVTLQVAARRKASKRLSYIPYILLFLAADFLATAISIKMNALLYLPGFLVVSYFLCNENLAKMALVVLFGVFIEGGINARFLFDPEVRAEFIDGAFNFSRQFLYRWTVNWKFVPEETFSSFSFQKGLLLLHITLLLAFLFHNWIAPTITGKSILKTIKDGLHPLVDSITSKNIILSSAGPQFVFDVMTLSNLIGVLCARSLHYQFLCWYFYSFPYLLYRTGLPGYFILPMFAAHEWCWDTYPSTPSSSLTLVVILAIVVIANFMRGTPSRTMQPPASKPKGGAKPGTAQ